MGANELPTPLRTPIGCAILAHAYYRGVLDEPVKSTILTLVLGAMQFVIYVWFCGSRFASFLFWAGDENRPSPFNHSRAFRKQQSENNPKSQLTILV